MFLHAFGKLGQGGYRNHADVCSKMHFVASITQRPGVEEHVFYHILTAGRAGEHVFYHTFRRSGVGEHVFYDILAAG